MTTKISILTESLVEQPMRMTHADVPEEELKLLGVSPGLIRISVGLEHISDLKRDDQLS